MKDSATQKYDFLFILKEQEKGSMYPPIWSDQRSKYWKLDDREFAVIYGTENSVTYRHASHKLSPDRYGT